VWSSDLAPVGEVFFIRSGPTFEGADGRGQRVFIGFGPTSGCVIPAVGGCRPLGRSVEGGWAGGAFRGDQARSSP
jgi:hypothetical protein